MAIALKCQEETGLDPLIGPGMLLPFQEIQYSDFCEKSFPRKLLTKRFLVIF